MTTTQITTTTAPYSCGRDYIPGIKYSGCWGFDPLTNSCIMKNPECFDLTCDEDKMSGYIRKDAFLDEDVDLESNELLLSLFNCADKSETIIRTTSMGIFFQLQLGECEMKTDQVERNGRRYIRFLQQFTSKESIHFQCLYPTFGVENSGKAMLIENSMEQIKTWENFEIHFAHQQLESMHLGEKILASVQWKSNMEATNVYWFLHECSLASGENYYEVIKNDCYSTLVNTRSAKESIFTQNSFAFDFTSFSFADSSSDNPSRMAFSLKCELKFCLSNYDCPVNKYCPHYYQLPVM